MTTPQRILFLPGDGIGPEVTAQARRVVDWLAGRAGAPRREVSEALVGGASRDVHGVPLTDEVLSAARAADAVILGAVGGPRWEGGERALRPEAALLTLRRALGVFANLRPAVCHPALARASSLRPEVVSGLDILIVRELTGGIYFGEPRGMERCPDGSERCVDTQAYSREEIVRIARVAFALARRRGGRLHSVEKANVMETGAFWRATVRALHQEEAADISLEHMYADNCAMQLVRDPRQFDVIVTDNLFGDILSDCAAMLTGSIGMLPSASLASVEGSRSRGLYEPVHGSAPDIAGLDRANPLAAIGCVAMMLRHSLADEAAATLVERAVADVLSAGIRTADLYGATSPVGCQAMGDAVIAAMERIGHPEHLP